MHVTAIAATHASLLSLPRPGRDGSRLSSPHSRVGICWPTYLDPLVTLGLLPLALPLRYHLHYSETEYRASCLVPRRAEARKLSQSG